MRIIAAAVAVSFSVASLFAASPKSDVITIRVDASDVARNIIHSHLKIPARSGAMTLYYPKWIPGEHGPTGPLVNLVGVKFSANEKAIPWSRDPYEMYAFRVEVPGGVQTLDVDLDYIEPA